MGEIHQSALLDHGDKEGRTVATVEGDLVKCCQ